MGLFNLSGWWLLITTATETLHQPLTFEEQMLVMMQSICLQES